MGFVGLDGEFFVLGIVFEGLFDGCFCLEGVCFLGGELLGFCVFLCVGLFGDLGEVFLFLEEFLLVELLGVCLFGVVFFFFVLFNLFFLMLLVN